MKLKVRSEACQRLITANALYVSALRQFGKLPSRERDEVCYEAKTEYQIAHCGYYVEDIQPNLKAYRKSLAPLRPSSLPSSDMDLIDELYKARGTAYSNKKSKITAMTFGAWRSAVLYSEGISAGNLTFLLRFTVSLREMGLRAELLDLAKFLLYEYGLNLPPYPDTEKEIRDVAWLHARRKDLLSDHLLTEEKTPLRLEEKEEYDEPHGVTYSMDLGE